MKTVNLINKIENFIGNKDAIIKIKNLINSEPLSKCILIKGPPVSGKTTLIKEILNELNINYNYIVASNLPNKKNISNFMDHYFNTYNIADLIFNVEQKNALIIDNLETLNNNHKHCIVELSKKCNKTDKVIIFITNKNHFKCSKIINDMSHVNTISYPTESEITCFIKANYPQFNDDWIKLAIKHSNKNIKDIYYFISNNKIVPQIKTCDNNLFNIVYKLLTNYSSLEEVIKYYNNDKYLLPLIFHENYLQYLDKINIHVNDKNNIMINVMKSLIDYDQLDNYMYAFQYWDLQDICGLISCSVGSYYINKYNKNPIFFNNINEEMKFTSYLNKVSLISINRKTISKLTNYFNVNDIYKLLRIRYLINNYDIDDEYLKKILTTYKITSKEIVSLKKIDKIDNKLLV